MEMLGELLTGKTSITILFFGAVFLLERLVPAARPQIGRMAGKAISPLLRVARNLGFAGINALISPLIVIPITVWASRWSLDWRPDWMTGSAGLVFDLLVLDFWIYWWHRANHRVPFLWRFHEVHHLDQFLDVTTAVRFHLGEVLLSAIVRGAIIIILAVPSMSVVIFETALLLATMFHHSNMKLPAGLERALSWLVVTPSIHWVHHHALRRDTDSNYATVLSIWDKLFASRSPTKRSPDLEIGVEGESEEPFLSLVSKPFRIQN
jgi:sterol desaturase/sphingolipid hydroxylase (fatty acid hydroxylase superfamily)